MKRYMVHFPFGSTYLLFGVQTNKEYTPDEVMNIVMNFVADHGLPQESRMLGGSCLLVDSEELPLPSCTPIMN